MDEFVGVTKKVVQARGFLRTAIPWHKFLLEIV